MSNVIILPRPRAQRPAAEGLGFYVRVSRNERRGRRHSAWRHNAAELSRVELAASAGPRRWFRAKLAGLCSAA